METLLEGAGFLLIVFFCTEPFQQGLRRLRAVLRQRPRLKYAAYPLAVLLCLGAAALIAHSVLALGISLRFSND